MPSDPADPKSLEILERTKAVFAAKGFDGASMQDLARAAGMSAGNFYRYFRSKDAIIEAIVTGELLRIEGEFRQVMQAPDVARALREVIGNRLVSETKTDGPLWAEIEASATRRAEVGALHERMECTVIDYLTAVFARIAECDAGTAAHRFGAHARLMLMIVRGHAALSCNKAAIAGENGPELTALISRMIDSILAEVAATGLDRSQKVAIHA